jgi:hypothetical protein
VLCPKVVKKKSALNHKIFGKACLDCLHVVVYVQRDRNADFRERLRFGAYDKGLVEIDGMPCAKREVFGPSSVASRKAADKRIKDGADSGASAVLFEATSTQLTCHAFAQKM